MSHSYDSTRSSASPALLVPKPTRPVSTRGHWQASFSKQNEKRASERPRLPSYGRCVTVGHSRDGAVVYMHTRYT